MLFLVDFENVGLKGLFGLNFLTEQDKVIIFKNSTQETIPEKIGKELISKANLDVVNLVKKGKNGLDFYISVCTGDYLAKNPKETVAIISNDRGYVAVCDYCNMIYHNKIILAPDICNSINILKNNLPIDFFNNENGNPVKFKELKDLSNKKLKTKKNETMCKISKIESKDLVLIDTFEKSRTPMAFYSKLLKTYGRTEGHRIYHALKDAGFKCCKKNE